ncbi:MAG: autotransporter outer membrane beta-barrel domain-containing protein [Kiloniellales bacterium]
MAVSGATIQQSGKGAGLSVLAEGGQGGDGGESKGGSSGLVGQSIGGNGGNGGTAANLNLNLSPSAVSGKSFNASFSFAMGGDGGSGNDAGDVAVTNQGQVVTEGTSSKGMIAQSVGGGGGHGGTASSMSISVASVCKLLGRTGKLSCGSGSGGGDSGNLTVASTATVDYGLSLTTNSRSEKEALLTYDVDYTPWNGSAAAQAKVPDGLRETINSNHTNFGDSLDGAIALQSEESAAFTDEPVNFLLVMPSVDELVDTYDRYAPGEIFAPSDAALFSSLRFAENLNSCPKQGPEGQVAFTRQGSCIWLQASGGGIDRQRSGNSIEYDERLFGFSLGGQTAVGEGFFLGGAFGYEDSSLSNARFSGDGSRFQGGVVVKKQFEQTTLTGSLSGGVGNYDLSRSVITPSGTVTAESSPNTNWISAHARVTQVFDVSEESYLRPWFDLGIDHQWQGGYRESGAGGYGLNVAAFDQTLVTLNPMLEVGGEFEILGAQANASAAAGLLAIVSGRDRSTDVGLLGFGAGGPTYLVSDQARPLFADIGANLEVKVHERAVISLGGRALLAGNQQEYGGTGRLSIFF